MTLHQWLIYVSVVLAIIVTPGPSALLCVSHGAAHGTLKAAATIVGGICASLTLMLLSALGLGAVLDRLLVFAATWLVLDGSVMLGYAKGGALAVANR